MYLSSIDIFGFKSFARRTRIDFAPGVTAIVGPNGCGKTNIVDAVRWVLGEQRESALRSERMDNVIFGGSEKKRPLGMAEISLTLQDTDGMLPVDYDEVTLTRRLFRSGKSEYLLNKTVCRLKDLVGLFMDTGVGPDSYSIIELKMVEDIISEDPNEIRHLLDEATGITRYKVRRKEALRRLIDARQDRERVLDILSEVEKQANSLKRQAAKARSYKRLQERVERIRSAIVYNRVQQYESRLLPLDDSLKEHRTLAEDKTAELGSSEATLIRLEGDLLNLENDRQAISRQYNQSQETYQEASHEKSRLEEEGRLNSWRLQDCSEDIDKVKSTLKQLDSQISEADEELNKSKGELPELDNTLQKRRKEFQDKDEKFKTARNLSLRNQQDLQALRESEADAIRSSEERKANIRTLRLRYDELNRRRDELLVQVGQRETELTSAQVDLDESTKVHDEASQYVKKNHEKLESLQEQLRKTESEYEQTENQKEQVKLQIEHIGELQRRESPVYPAGGLLAEKFPGEISATLGDELQVEDRYVVPVESALRGMFYCRVLQESQSFKMILDCLSGEKNGRAAILTGSPPSFDLSGIFDFASKTNGTPLAEVIQGDSVISQWIRYLLCSTVLYETIKEIQNVKKNALKNNLSLVALSGEFTDARGFWIIGTTGEKSHKAVGVSNRMTELARELRSLEENSTNLEASISEIRRQVEELRTEVQTSQKSLSTARLDLDNLTVKRMKLDAQIVSSSPIIEQLGSEIEGIPARIEKLSSAEEAQEIEIDNVVNRLAEAEEQLKNFMTTEAETLEGREEVHKKLASVEIDFERARARIDRATDHQSSLQNRKGRLDERLTELSQNRDNYTALKEKIVDQLSNKQEKVTELGAFVKDHKEKLDDLDSQRRALQEEHHQAGQKVRELRSKLEEISESVHQIQLEKVQIETTLGEERQKLDGVDLGEIKDEDADEELLFDLEKKMIAAEPLNLAAEGEYFEQKKRLDFLSEQLQDLNEAEKSLEETITTLNSEARERFDEGFQRVKDNFRKIFCDLFEGGDADLRLTEDNSLESRIEVLATPGKKKIGALSLLSGGEKALTAISLLFAIYLEKPSPFCILDEVDAPLDEENTMRFNHLLDKLTPKTQFLIVTHNKRTMEVADNLLGVTMEENGISKVVPVQIN
ncbi:chromosome segregation protein SMC [candidate division LCP-89 bacterium B3_LCP]|uniref:Chromosome partition protein Smc n=1 Tax=candidate division LCP-89 bacterium B3_LCP TaxID=2012998 RepID=A0A532UZ77_UNCL8|nr:MAG: chromosome segregation protein SMC [candidate division LCP-89 bacterium B3_LCP]